MSRDPRGEPALLFKADYIPLLKKHIMSSINPSPLRPRFRLFSGAKATLASLTRKWNDNDLIYTDEDPDILYRGTKTGGAFSTLQAIATRTVRNILTAVNATATATAAAIKAGVITSTSVAAVVLTLPTTALLVAALAAAQGDWHDFAVDNSAGANTVTVAVGTGMTVATAVVTGGDTLTVAAGKVGIFRIYFKSGTTSLLYRMG